MRGRGSAARTAPLLRTALAIGVLALGVTAGCGTQGGDDDPGSGSGSSTGSSSEEGDGSATGSSGDSGAGDAEEDPGPAGDEQPRDDLQDEEVVEWTDMEQVTPRRLRFFFPSGTPDCYGVRAVVEEDAEEVRVATIVGTVPDAPDRCTLDGLLASLVVDLDRPLGNRTVAPLDPSDALP